MDEAAANPQKIKIFNASANRVEEVEKILKTDAEWRKILTAQEFSILRLKGTEIPFTGQCAIPKKKEKGIYQCAACGTDLFKVETKFESGTGWPSFFQPVSELNLLLRPDNSSGMHRMEALCARCDGHLGHVFDDGPPPSGKRYCINAVAIKFKKTPDPHHEAAFGAGCFWGVEAAFRKVKGVITTEVGYMGGTSKNPAYEEVCSGGTGHAETVRLEYDPDTVSYEDLLNYFWHIHDPGSLNRQGPDIGSQYRSVIFYYTPEQKRAAEASKRELEASGKVKMPVVTEIAPAGEFYRAEEYHQRYHEKHGNLPSCPVPLKRER